MEWNRNEVVWLGVGILLGMLIITLLDKKFAKDGTMFGAPDTTYNKVKLDSITFQKGKHDTTIYKLNIKLKDDVEKSYQLNDSSTVDLFKQLTTGTGTIK